MICDFLTTELDRLSARLLNDVQKVWTHNGCGIKRAGQMFGEVDIYRAK